MSAGVLWSCYKYINFAFVSTLYFIKGVQTGIDEVHMYMYRFGAFVIYHICFSFLASLTSQLVLSVCTCINFVVALCTKILTANVQSLSTNQNTKCSCTSPSSAGNCACTPVVRTVFVSCRSFCEHNVTVTATAVSADHCDALDGVQKFLQLYHGSHLS